MKIAIGSLNPTKIQAVQSIVGKIATIHSFDVPSHVSEQPVGDEETIQGAINRAKECFTKSDFDFAIGLEGGVAKTPFGLMVINWGALINRNQQIWIASGARAVLPKEVEILILEGKTLGDAIDLYTKRNGVSKKEGAMGIITNSRICRDEMFAHVVKALVGQYEFYLNH